MRRFGFVVAASVLLCGTSAFAQSVTDVTGSGANILFVDGTITGTGDGTASQGSNRAAYSAFHDTLGNPIVFESSNQLIGFGATNFTSTSVDIHIDNPGGNAFQFQSTITAAGMGFYVANTGGGCINTGTCLQGALGFDDFAGEANPGSDFMGVTNVVALAQFSFDVLGVDDRGAESVLYNRSGFTALRLASLTDLQVVGVMDTGTNGGVSDLLGFGQVDNNASAFTYTWDATNFSFNVGGQYSTLRYRSTVGTSTRTGCLNDGTALETCILSFSAFGDPIGRGGDIESAVASLGFDFGALDEPLGPITGIDGHRANFVRPEFHGGNLFFQDVTTASVPEPAAWAVMILGFGLAGTALRRRRIVAA